MVNEAGPGGPGDVVDRIDAAVDGKCACGCGDTLRPDGPSAYFATQDCQRYWQGQHHAHDPDDVYERPDADWGWDPAPSVTPERDRADRPTVRRAGRGLGTFPEMPLPVGARLGELRSLCEAAGWNDIGYTEDGARVRELVLTPEQQARGWRLEVRWEREEPVDMTYFRDGPHFRLTSPPRVTYRVRLVDDAGNEVVSHG
jgi:hypothetical protein